MRDDHRAALGIAHVTPHQKAPPADALRRRRALPERIALTRGTRSGQCSPVSTPSEFLKTPPHAADEQAGPAGEPVDARAAMDALGDAVAVVDADWRVRYMNASWERILGVRRDAAWGREFWATYPGFLVEPGAAMIRDCAGDGVTRRFDLEHNVGGELRAYGVRVARDRTGALVVAVSRAFATLRTARDKALEERSEENESLRALARQMSEVADSAELLALLCDAAASLCRGHGAAVLRATDTEAEIVAAVGIAKQVDGLKFSLAGSLVQEAIVTREVAAVDDFGHSDRPRAQILGRAQVGPLLMAPLIAHDRVLGTLAVMRDFQSIPFNARESQRLRVIADHAALALWKEQLYEQAQAAGEAKGRFLGTISHELRTPLTALTGYEELLTDQVIGPLSDAQMDVLARMRAVTQHLASMIEEVLAYTSLEQGHEVVRPTDFLADDLLVAAAAVVEPAARRKQIALICASSVEPIRLTSGVDKARQVLVNLAGNAVKFTDAGEIRLSVAREGAEVRFAVQDTGIGISPTDLAQLFHPFAQVETGLTRRYGGTGLGLYISRRLAGLLGGRVEVESTPGLGSTFTLVLPTEGPAWTP
jgi:signal transduction histidine kinase